MRIIFLWLGSGADDGSIESVCSVRQNPETIGPVPNSEVTTLLGVDRKREEMVAVSGIGKSNWPEVRCIGIGIGIG